MEYFTCAACGSGHAQSENRSRRTKQRVRGSTRELINRQLSLDDGVSGHYFLKFWVRSVISAWPTTRTLSRQPFQSAEDGPPEEERDSQADNNGG
jgi:hypothetical protein